DVVQSGPKHCREPLRSAKQVDVLPDEAGIDRCVESAILGRDVTDSFAVSDIDEVQWSLGDKILRTGLGANVTAQMRQQLVRLRLVKPDAVSHCRVDVDHHDMPPIR